MWHRAARLHLTLDARCNHRETTAQQAGGEDDRGDGSLMLLVLATYVRFFLPDCPLAGNHFEQPRPIGDLQLLTEP